MKDTIAGKIIGLVHVDIGFTIDGHADSLGHYHHKVFTGQCRNVAGGQVGSKDVGTNSVVQQDGGDLVCG